MRQAWHSFAEQCTLHFMLVNSTTDVEPVMIWIIIVNWISFAKLNLIAKTVPFHLLVL